jgi:hypothetical protein
VGVLLLVSPALAMLDLGMLALKGLALVGGFAVGAFLTGGLMRLLVRALTTRPVPRALLWLVRMLGGAALALAVWLWVTGTGDFGPGRGGLWGLGGPGADGEPSESTTHQTSLTSPPRAEPPAPEPPPAEGPEVLRVLMLGGSRVSEKRFYRLEGQEQPLTLADLSQALRERRDKQASLKRLEVVVYENSVAADHPAVRDLQRWARENDWAVTLSFPKSDLP